MTRQRLETWLSLVAAAWPLVWSLDREPPLTLIGEHGPLVVEIRDAGATPTVTVWTDDLLVLEEVPVATPRAAVAQAHAAFAAKRAVWLAVPDPALAGTQEATPDDTGRVP